ncbi:MAG: hypothetical protein HOI76_03810 [Microbacteriaceae bacterium]|nr:hypothetical protein [Microbacteriaceae bacterium]
MNTLESEPSATDSVDLLSAGSVDSLTGVDAQALITRLSAASTAPGPLRRSTFFTSNTLVLLLRRGNPRAS